MSKYIKLEDAIHNINLEVVGRKEYTGDMKANLFFALDDLPTIEVHEYADKDQAYMEGYAKGVVYGRLLKDEPSENKCHRHGIRTEDGTPIYECIGCDKQDCETK